MKRRIYIPHGTDLAALADRVEYVGSPEHKDFPSFAGSPHPRADASCCPRDIRDQVAVSEWLRTAIRRGAVGAPWEAGFPRYVWFKRDDVVFEGRLVNREQGTYKGYPLNRQEWPPDIEDVYATH